MKNTLENYTKAINIFLEEFKANYIDSLELETKEIKDKHFNQFIENTFKSPNGRS